MVFSFVEFSIFLFFDLAFGRWYGRYYLFDGDFFLQIAAKKDEREKMEKENLT